MTLLLWAGRVISALLLATVVFGLPITRWVVCVAYGALLAQFWTIDILRRQVRGWRAMVRAQTAARPMVIGEVLTEGDGAPS